MGDKTFSASMPDSEGTGGHGRVGLGLENSETHLSPCNLLSFETVPRDVSYVEKQLEVSVPRSSEFWRGRP